MDKNYILSVICDYANEYLREPRKRLPKGCFEERSYRIWAIEELLKQVDKYGDDSPVAVVENFICKMNAFSRRNRKAGIIFSIARDVAEDILDILAAMK